VLTLLRQQWFLLVLFAVLALGMLLPVQLGTLAEAIPRSLVVASVLFVMSLTLAAESMWRAVRMPGAALLAIAINSGLAPPLSWMIGQALPAELAIGLVVAATSPCTLASAAVWTRRAGGSDAVALLVTMVTNLTCFAVVPAWLQLLLGRSAEFDVADLTIRLFQLAVVPILAGQLLRRWPRLAAAADRHKLSLGIAAQIGILSIVFVGAVHVGQTLADVNAAHALSWRLALTLIASVVVLHVLLLAAGLWTAARSGMSHPDRAAVAMAGSQKTLMIGIDVALGFGGLAILPMVAYHAVQLVIDTVVADWLRARVAEP
jgi:sodium/bile acid cotransporter 7